MNLISNLSSRLLRAAIRAVAATPTWALQRAAAVISRGIALLGARERTIIELQSARFLGSTLSAREVFYHALLQVFEMTNLARHLNQIRGPSRSQLDAMLSDRGDRPVLALTAHLGNWDLLGAYVAQIGYQSFAIGKPLRWEALQSVLEELRARNGIQVLWRAGPSQAKEIIRALKSGGIVAALCDQDTKVDGMMVPFFGTPAYTPSSVVTLAHRYNAIFVTAFCVRTEDNQFEVIIERLPPAACATPEGVLTYYNQRLETLIRAHPTQWVWFHKRWRQQGENRRSAAEYLAWLRQGSSICAG